MSLKFVNERAVQNIIDDNTYNSDVDASDSDIDFSHAITESHGSFDSKDEEPFSKHVHSALNDASADASNAVDFDSEYEEPLSKHAPPSSNISADASTTVKSGKKNASQYLWRAKNIKYLNENTFFIYEDSPLSDDFECSTPLSYFKMFFNENMLDQAVLQTNIYSTQCNINKGAIGIDKAELERHVGILLTMSIISAPYYRFYWELETHYELIASAMSGDRFESLKRFLHFNDNTKDKKRDDETRDRLFKIRPLLEMLRQDCLSQKPEEHNSIDEQMIPFKDRSFLRSYMPEKPKKWGFKIFSRNELSGTRYEFEFDGAPDPDKVEQIDEIGYCW